jgi:hypothetical protein
MRDYSMLELEAILGWNYGGMGGPDRENVVNNAHCAGTIIARRALNA